MKKIKNLFSPPPADLSTIIKNLKYRGSIVSGQKEHDHWLQKLQSYLQHHTSESETIEVIHQAIKEERFEVFNCLINNESHKLSSDSSQKLRSQYAKIPLELQIFLLFDGGYREADKAALPAYVRWCLDHREATCLKRLESAKTADGRQLVRIVGSTTDKTTQQPEPVLLHCLHDDELEKAIDSYEPDKCNAMFEFLLAHGVKSTGILQYALRRSSAPVIGIIPHLKSFAPNDLIAPDDNGHTPLQVAMSYSHKTEVLEKLASIEGCWNE